MVVVILNSGKTTTPSLPYRSISGISAQRHTGAIFSGRRGQGWSTQFLTPFSRWAANAKPNRGGRACLGLATTVVTASLLGPAVPGARPDGTHREIDGWIHSSEMGSNRTSHRADVTWVLFARPAATQVQHQRRPDHDGGEGARTWNLDSGYM